MTTVYLSDVDTWVIDQGSKDEIKAHFNKQAEQLAKANTLLQTYAGAIAGLRTWAETRPHPIEPVELRLKMLELLETNKNPEVLK